MINKKFKLSPTQIIMLGFIAVIIIGSVLLSLPISTKSGNSLPYVDALFTATTATCVTGLVTVPTVTTFSTFGQVVILILIQIGGLGVITVMSGIMLALHKKMKLSDRFLLQDAFNLNTLSGLSDFVKRVIIGTFIVESSGALLYMTVFIPEFGVSGIWISVFNSVSAFCNAGIDIISTDSLCAYATNPLINVVTALLIILGGIGYIVWWDVLRVLKLFKKEKHRAFKKLTLHSKIAISSTLILIFVGAVFIFAFEYGNPLTIGGRNLFDKIQISLFQSVTTRTAGFATIPQEALTTSSSIICLVLMFIGGSPVGTAGGIKTVTAAIIIISAYSVILNKNEVTLFNRSVSRQAIGKAVAVACMSFSIMLISTVILSLVSDASFLDIIYEAVSATATVGLTRNFTATLNLVGKITIIFTMYLGRVGPISLAFAFKTKKDAPSIVKNPTEDISVG